MSKVKFDECIREIIPADSMDPGMDPETRRSLSATLSSIFHAFSRAGPDRDGNDGTSAVNALEFAAGFAVFCEGNKSDKLAFAFETMDDGGNGRLGRRAMWRFARAFLTVLVEIGGRFEDKEEFREVVDGGAVRTAASVFAGRKGGGEREERGVVFDEFAEWYTGGGFRDNSWLELLDLRKWAL